jgi:phenylalanyl-tRNA synthetase beta chain
VPFCIVQVKWPDYAGKADVGEKGDLKSKQRQTSAPAILARSSIMSRSVLHQNGCSSILNAAGINSINNVVDISNFVMLETGQPLHYYDLKKLKAHEITVVDDQELTMKALDGNEFAIQKG